MSPLAPRGGDGEAARSARGPESRVLGELLATPTFLLTLPSAERLAEFVARAVAYVPGVAECMVCLPGVNVHTKGFSGEACDGCPARQKGGPSISPIPPAHACHLADLPGRYVISCSTPSGVFGLIVCQLGHSESFAPYAPFLDNWGNFIGLALENRHHREELEEAVATRTLELQRQSDELRREIDERGREVAERKKAEEGMRQAQKMEAFGQLAGGVAHDFNNLLTVIQGNVTLARLVGSLSSEQAVALDEIANAAQRAANLTRQLLMFSRRQAVQMRDLDLNEIVGNMTKMLQRLIGEHITLVARHAPGSARIHADPGMIEQVLMNLAVNSRDAMSKGGELTIQTDVITIGASATSPHARPGEFVRLTVTDSGSGIAPEHLPRIFEPFFTTKGVGRGTGLGLATVFGIVEQHHGWIEVESALSVGTTFRIYLPVVQAPPTSGVARREVAESPGGDETILLVEDEVALRALARRVLAGKGYRVLEAGTGAEALEMWRKHGEAIQLLLTDMVMPGGMTGRDLAKRILSESPSLPVIYSTGYTDEMLGDDSTLREKANFLEKPYEASRLLKMVRSVLDRRSSRS